MNLGEFSGSLFPHAINVHKFAQLPLLCQKCEQMDFVLVERNGQILTDRCSCARGRRLLAWKAA